jgi:iron complex transport system substrate-binding protein
MTRRTALFAAVLLGAALPVAALAAEQGNPTARRIVSVGGTITEILYDLGAQDRIVARDSTSSFPVEVNSKPDVGYMRALSAEGILAQKPDLILMEEGAGPPPVVDILKASDIPVVVIPTPPDAGRIGGKIREVGAAVGLSGAAEALAVQTERDLAALAGTIANLPERRKTVLFVLSVSNGRIMAGGANTAAQAIIGLAGGSNAAPEISGYKLLSDEAVIAAQPDVILSMSTNGDHRISPDQIFAMPSLQTTPAAANKALISMDGLLLLGLGPRTPQTARALAAQLYPGVIN